MGLTLIRKGEGRPRKRKPNLALVLAGGAVSGGAFKVGGLKALNDYLVGRRMTDFDTYVGLSAGAMLGVPLAAGITPDEMVRVLEGTSRRFDQLSPLAFYRPALDEYTLRPAKFLYDLFTYAPGVAWDTIRQVPELPEVMGPTLGRFLEKPGYTRAEEAAMTFLEHVTPTREIPALTNHIPSGIFDNVGLERWLRRNLERIGMPNDFEAFEQRRGCRLYVTACNLDTADRVIFGRGEYEGVPISRAVQASTALPIFFKPARIDGVDFVDGGIRNTANIDVAIEKGADLIVCYNPFRPFLNRVEEESHAETFAAGRYLSDHGMKMVIFQVFRTLLHSRLRIALQGYAADDRFQGDIVLIEPRETDAEYFNINPLAFWKRADAIRQGFESVRTTVEQNLEPLDEVFGRYGLEMDPKLARRRAGRIRTARGWRVTEAEDAEPSPARPDLRVVGGRGRV